MTIKTYTELVAIPSFAERFKYLQLDGRVGEITFGGSRYLNQMLYSCPEWKHIRDRVILRDEGCDLAHPDYALHERAVIHHINPITIEDIVNRNPCVFDLDNLVCCSYRTHQAIHYGNESLLPSELVPRRPNDTCPWK